MNQPLAQEHPRHAPHHECLAAADCDIDTLLGGYDAKSVMQQLLTQLDLGKRLGEKLLEPDADVQSVLAEFKVKAPTKTEVILGKAKGPDDGFREEPTAASGLLLVTAADAESNDEPRPITVINEHVRMGVYLSVVKTLMRVSGSTYAEYARYRDAFGDGMTKEFAENDKANKSAGGGEAASKPTDGKILTLADFNDRLERRVEELMMCLRNDAREKTRSSDAPHLFVPSEATSR